MSTPEPPVAIRLDQVSKTYHVYARPADRLRQSLLRGKRRYFTEHAALQPLSLSIPQGQTVGIIGENGSGKSTLLQLITGTLSPTQGSIEVNGRVSALLELGAGFNPEFTGIENIRLNAAILGLSEAELAQRYADILSFSGLEERLLHQPVHTYSSGMYVRLAFSVAISTSPDILIVDEALAVGDEGFQRKCFARIHALQQAGTTILFVSHSARTIIDLCSHALLLDHGELLMQGSPKEVVTSYHRMLFAPVQERAAIREAIRGIVPLALPSGEVTPDAPMAEPESRIAYAQDGACIEHVQLQDAQGSPTRQLHSGATYTLRMRVRLSEAIEAEVLRVSMMIKTRTGIELAGTLARLPSDSPAMLEAGSMLEVAFRFPCLLTREDYFLNVGVCEECFGSYRFLHRIVDALHVKVTDINAHDAPLVQPRGFIDIGTQCDISVEATQPASQPVAAATARTAH